MRALFKRNRAQYSGDVPIGRPPHQRITPVPHLAELDRWVDHWVAVKGGTVIAAAKSSRDLAYRLREMGPQAKGAVMQYVRPNTDGYVIGVG
jgi:hypothetical protein